MIGTSTRLTRHEKHMSFMSLNTQKEEKIKEALNRMTQNLHKFFKVNSLFEQQADLHKAVLLTLCVCVCVCVCVVVAPCMLRVSVFTESSSRRCGIICTALGDRPSWLQPSSSFSVVTLRPQRS